MSIESIDFNAIFGTTGTILALTACTAGVGWRTWSKWYDKLKKGEDVPFDRKFIWQALGSLGGALVLAIPLLSTATEMINQWAGTAGLLIAWIVTAGWAFFVNDSTNGIIKTIEGKAVTRAVKSGKLDKIIAQRMKEIQQQGGSSPPSSTATTPTTKP